jgi:signal transduction histidine kinase
MREVIDQVTASILEARKGLEQALTDLEKLPAIDPHSLGFAAHALQNYLTVISGTTELLSMKVANHPEPEVQTWMAYMRQATELMGRIVADLMNAATVSRKPALKCDKVNLTKLLQRFSDGYQVKATEKRIQVTYKPVQDKVFVLADGVALAAVLDNLFSNALKYSPLDGEVHVTLWKDSGTVVCAVEDHGQGLSREDQAKLFQRGVKLSAVPTGGEPSSGYGLAVAKELTSLMNGEMWCESDLGKGAKFFVRLPRYDEANETSSGPPEMPAR